MVVVDTHHCLTFSPLQVLAIIVQFHFVHVINIILATSFISIAGRSIESPLFIWIMTSLLFLLSPFTPKIASIPRAVVNIATNEVVIIFSILDNGENTPPAVNEVDLNNLNNKHILQYIQRQATLGQYKTWEETSKMDPERRDKASVDTLRAQIKVTKLQPKGRAESEDESDEAPKGVDWKLIRAVQRY